MIRQLAPIYLTVPTQGTKVIIRLCQNS